MQLKDYIECINESVSLDTKQVGGSHYQVAEIQPWDVMLAYGLDPWSANVIKYLLRFPYKNGVEDLEKAKHYIEFLIANYESIDKKYYS
jgi:hypothetical protein